MNSYGTIFKISALTSLIAANLSYWVFYGQEKFLPVPLAVGALFIMAQKADRVYKFLGRLLFGALTFGFLTAFLVYLEMYLLANWFYNSGLPFWPFYNPREYLIFSLVFSFLSLLGGLIGAVIRGFFVLIKRRSARQS